MRRPQKEIPLDVIDKRHKSRIRSVAADHKTPQPSSRSMSHHRSCSLSVSVSCPAEMRGDADAVDVDFVPGPGRGSSLCYRPKYITPDVVPTMRMANDSEQRLGLAF